MIILKYYWHDVPVSDTYLRHQGIHQSSLSLFLSVHLLRITIDHTQLSLQAHRLLLQDSGAAAAAKVGNLYNVATVTLEANCSSEQAVPATLTEMQSVMANQLLAVSSNILSTNWTDKFWSSRFNEWKNKSAPLVLLHDAFFFPVYLASYTMSMYEAVAESNVDVISCHLTCSSLEKLLLADIHLHYAVGQSCFWTVLLCPRRVRIFAFKGTLAIKLKLYFALT